METNSKPNFMGMASKKVTRPIPRKGMETALEVLKLKSYEHVTQPIPRKGMETERSRSTI